MLKIVCILCLLCGPGALAVTRPPGIYIQPEAPYDVFYKYGETVELPCVAEGSPRPEYKWMRNGREFNPSGNDDRVVQLYNVGTLVITKPEDKDEGIFQCFAKNQYGISVSVNMNLREAKLKNFEIRDDVHLYPELGKNLTLNCVPPESIPMAHVFWVIRSKYGAYVPVNYDDRVTMDIEYRLRFANIVPSDYQDGKAYACVAKNDFTRNATQGRQYFIHPHGATPRQTSVEYMWSSPQDHMGLRGSTFRVKCIFSGNPTPDVHWERADGYPLPERAQIRSFGMELLIEDLQFEDAGEYECWATNVNMQTRVQRTVNVRVESSPYWLLEPQDIEISEGGTAEYNCLAKAVPEPDYRWFVNGRSLNNMTDPRLTPDRFKLIRKDRLVLTNVRLSDPLVVQCNASNKHGYIWADAYLNVLSEAPTIIEPPKERQVVAEGTHINITCRVAGKPDPIITWYKDDQQITGGRYKIMPTGDLNIKHVVLSDAGSYLCEARNKMNSTSAGGTLLVRRKTRIELAPLDLDVNSGTDAKFTCSGTTDPEEVGNLRVLWKKDNKPISNIVQRMTTNYQDNSLIISGTIVRDSGAYTCVVTNGLDEDEATAMLMVRDRPDPPSKVSWTKCEGGEAMIEWMPGTYNNAPVQYYIVQYNTSFNPDIWNFGVRVDSIYSTANMSLSPWVNYTFRVIAYNKLGESDPSFPNATICATKEDFPDVNPSNVRTLGDRPDYLHIMWTPMPEIMHNGKGFQYNLLITREGFDEDELPVYIDDWRTYEYFYQTSGQIYEPYRIRMVAQNSLGPARADAVVIRGFTAEAIPIEKPRNLRVQNVADTYADLVWDFSYNEIKNVPINIRGEFRGFKIQFWEKGDKQNTLREWDVWPDEALQSRVGDTFTARVGNLLPLTELEANVAVMNNYYVSAPSDIVAFRTEPGFPGPVEMFREINIGDNHVNLEWQPPEENRGDILGYDISYRTVNGLDLGEMQDRDPQVEDPYTTTAMLSGLLADTRYRVYIYARTAKGRGEPYFIEITTTSVGDPQAPRFTISDVGQHYINVSWWINPYAASGTVVYVEYRKEDSAVWLRTTDEVISSWKNISSLEAGTLYEVRVVATNGGVRSLSHIEEVTTKGVALASALVGNWGWFVGMLLALLMMIGLIVFFVVVFKRGFRFKQKQSPSSSYYGGDYPVAYSDKERFPKGGAEPRSYRNDYYDDRDYDEDDYPDDRDYDRSFDYEKGTDRRHEKDRLYDDEYDEDRRYSQDYGYEGYDGEESERSGRRRQRPVSDHPYEDYDRQNSAGYDPDFQEHDYRELDRFDATGKPVDLVGRREEKDQRYDLKTGLHDEKNQRYDLKTGRHDEKDQRYDRQPGRYGEKDQRYDRQPGRMDEKDQRYDLKSGRNDEKDQRYDMKTGSHDQKDQRYDLKADTHYGKDHRYDRKSAHPDEKAQRYDREPGHLDQKDQRYDLKSGRHDEKDQRYDMKTGPHDQKDQRYDRKAGTHFEKDQRYDRGPVRLDEKDQRYDREPGRFDEKGQRYDLSGRNDEKDQRYDIKTGPHDQKDQRYDRKAGTHFEKDQRYDIKPVRSDDKDQRYDRKPGRRDDKDQRYDREPGRHDEKDQRYDRQLPRRDDYDGKDHHPSTSYGDVRNNKDHRYDRDDRDRGGPGLQGTSV